MSRITSRVLGLVLLVALATPSAVWAQTENSSRLTLLFDPLDDVRKREKIAAEALEADIKAALADAEKLQAKEPEKAALLLRYALTKLEADTALTSVRRLALKNAVQDRITANTTAGGKPKPEPVVKPQPKDPEPKNAELERDLKQLRILRQVGELGQAAKLADEINKRYPDQAAADAARRVTANELQLREQVRFLNEKEWNTALAMREVDKSAVPIVGDIEYPKDWAEKSARRLKKYHEGRLNLTKKEAEILKILDSPMTKPLDLKGASFDSMLDVFSDVYKLPIMIDGKAIKELDIDYTTTKIFARMPKGISVRTGLRAALADAGLTYLIKNEAIYITSPDRAQNELVTRVYPLDDLLGVGSPFLFNNPFRQQMEQMEQEAKAQKIIDLIKGLVEPGSWKENGGAGTIVYDPLTRSLIIKNTSEVINSLGGGMKKE